MPPQPHEHPGFYFFKVIGYVQRTELSGPSGHESHRIMANKWDAVEMAPADPILGVAVAYRADPLPPSQKVNLGIGAYRDSDGNPLVLKCVREAEKKIANDMAMNKEYLPVEGLDRFLKNTSAVIFGKESSVIKEGRVAVCQSLSGTGALRIAAEFIAMYHPKSLVYCSNPTWGNHFAIFKKAHLNTTTYRYLNKDMTLDIDGMLADLSAAPKGSTFVLHTVAHNPTGVDPTQDQWKRIADVCIARDAIVLFDTAYQVCVYVCVCVWVGGYKLYMYTSKYVYYTYIYVYI